MSSRNKLDNQLHIAEVEYEGKTFQFLNNSRQDHIQKVLNSGSFYEIEELELIRKYAPKANRLLDVGANIGNHTIFLAHMLDLELAIPIEPQPAVQIPLRANIGLNWHRSFDLGYLGIGLGQETGTAIISRFSEKNLGGTQLSLQRSIETSTQDETIQVHSGDYLFPNYHFDLIKIDAEGMELQIIKGLRKNLEKFGGVVFLEVLDQNAEDLSRLVDEIGLTIVSEYRRYARCTNWLLKRL